VDELWLLLEGFLGEAGWTRCFTHMNNLVVKIVLYIFDFKKKLSGKGADGDLLEELGDMLVEPEEAADDEIEREDSAEEDDDDGEGDGEEEDDEESSDDDDEGPKSDDISAAELEAAKLEAKPVCEVISKVSPYFCSLCIC
jgi:hypothetical protein